MITYIFVFHFVIDVKLVGHLEFLASSQPPLHSSLHRKYLLSLYTLNITLWLFIDLTFFNNKRLIIEYSLASHLPN